MCVCVCRRLCQESPLLKELVEETSVAFPQAAHMVSGHEQGRLFEALARLTKACSVLEIGTFTGYAALCFAEGVPQVT